MKTCVLRPLTVAVLAVLPLLAMANDAERTLGEVRVYGQQPSADGLNLDARASTASRLGLSVRDTPATVSVVSRDTLEKWSVSNTQEMLTHVPGVTAASPPGSAGSVFYRGFGAAQLTQLFNGVTVQYDAIAARPVDSWIYDRVEVIGGPSSFLFGAGAVGGSINYLTKLQQRGEDFMQARLSYGSFDAHEVALGVNRTLGGQDGGMTHTVRADLSQRRSQGYVDGNNREAFTGAVSLLSDITPRLSHTLALEYQRETDHRPYWGTPLLNPTSHGQIDDSLRFKNYNAEDGIYQQTVKWARSMLEYQWTDSTQLRNTLYHYEALRDYRNVESYRYNSSNSAVIRSSALLQRHDQDLTGNRIELTHQGELAGRKSDWAAGVDYSVNHQTRYPLSLGSNVISTVNPSQFSTESFFSIPGMTPGFRPDRSNTVSTVALFLENRTQLSPQWSLLTGLRHDQIKLEVRNHRTASATDPAFFSQTYTPTTGRVALSYALSPSANAYVQYSTAADPPAGILSTASFSQVRNFDLTKGRQVEVGSKFDYWQGRGSATVAAYHIVRKNLAISDPNQPGVTIPVGQQSSRGIELATSLRVAPRWRVQADLALVDAQYDTFTETVNGAAVSRAGNRPSNIPARVANLRISHELSSALQLGVDARYVSRRYADAANTISDKAYTLLGASLNYRLNKHAAVSARVNNLTDRAYAASASTGQFYLGAPRSAEVALRLDF